MRLLLDTHAALWFFQGDPRLPASARERIEEAGAAAHVSMASLWEIAIKVSLKKLTLPGEFAALFSSAIRVGDLKLIEIPGVYDLASDPGESKNLAAPRLANTQRLLAKLNAWRESVGASTQPKVRKKAAR